MKSCSALKLLIDIARLDIRLWSRERSHDLVCRLSLPYLTCWMSYVAVYVNYFFRNNVFNKIYIEKNLKQDL